MDALNVNMADFSLNLLKEVGVNNSNVFCSPLSISIVLAMTFAGSGGDTKKQIRSTIFGNDTNDETIHSAFNNILTDSLALPAGEPRTGSRGAVLNRGELLRLQIANSLFPSKRLMTGHPIHQNYLTMLRNNYKLEGDIPILDYSQAESAAKFINDWINAKTSGKIKNLIAKESLTANTAMLLVNAIYFKSKKKILP